MRNWVSIAITAIIALAIGYSLRPPTRLPERLAGLPRTSTPLYVPDSPLGEPEVPLAPDYPKPMLETPVAVPETFLAAEQNIPSGTPRPEPLVGDIPSLPNAGIGGPTDSIAPLAPDVPAKLPVADLNADEALARRIVLQRGGDVVASSDAKDGSGKVGRTLVAEIDVSAASALRTGLRKALGDRIVLSDAGTVSSFSPALKKAEEALAAAKKRVEQARIDFLPQAPALRQIEEDYLAQERAVAEERKTSSRVRLSLLLRPTLGG